MKKIKILIATLMIAVILVAGIGAYYWLKQDQVKKDNQRSTIEIGTPTLFFHGYGSSYKAEEHMTSAAKKAHVTNIVIRADVSSDNKVTFIGQIPSKTKNPIVEVNLQDSSNGSSKNVLAVVKALTRKYKFKKINFVGHSYGNLMVANYINENYDNQKLPEINKIVSIAGHYNGWLGEKVGRQGKIIDRSTGKPDEFALSFKQLLPLRRHYPRQIEVLNIYGDKEDGSRGDGSVSVASAQTYRYLINGRTKSYKEVEIKGAKAQHSKLHENTQVDKLIIKFLWNK